MKNFNSLLLTILIFSSTKILSELPDYFENYVEHPWNDYTIYKFPWSAKWNVENVTTFTQKNLKLLNDPEKTTDVFIREINVEQDSSQYLLGRVNKN